MVKALSPEIGGCQCKDYSRVAEAIINMGRTERAGRLSIEYGGDF